MIKPSCKVALFIALSTAPAIASPVEMIKRINRDNFNLPETLVVGVAKVESGFKCHVTGGVGEVGLYQLKYATAKGIGYRGSRQALYNCETNAYYGLKHLKIAYDKCGTIKGAAKLHNAGLGASCRSSAYSYKVVAAGGASYHSSEPRKGRKHNVKHKLAIKPPYHDVMEYLMNKPISNN
jgi:soluble lytic murein transglycosylase-like protein